MVGTIPSPPEAGLCGELLRGFLVGGLRNVSCGLLIWNCGFPVSNFQFQVSSVQYVKLSISNVTSLTFEFYLTTLLQLVFFYLFHQGSPLEMEKFGCLILNPFGPFQGLEDEGFFKLAYRGMQTYSIL